MKGYIYKLTSEQTQDVYIGSTTQSLKKRLKDHRSDYKGQLNNMTSFKLMKYPDVKIELIEEVEFDERNKLNLREGYYQKTIPCVNKLISGQTHNEYNCKKIDCECGGKYMMGNRAKHFNTMKHLLFTIKKK